MCGCRANLYGSESTHRGTSGNRGSDALSGDVHNDLLYLIVCYSIPSKTYFMSKELIHLSRDEIATNGRIRYLPDENGVYKPYELLAFSKRSFIPPGYESSCAKNPSSKTERLFDSIEASEFSRLENRRKAFNRARNNLFDIAMSTTSFDCFVTLTLDSKQVDRYSYDEVIKKLNVWLSNRVQRNCLTYVLVPEYHKDKAIHFHGLCNFAALKTVRAVSPSGRELSDNADRPIYNIVDFKLGHNTVIPLSGENARTATTKYCYKYITKSGGNMVGGRYYLSGGELGRPKYKYINVDFDSLPCEVISVGGIIEVKKYKYKGENEDEFCQSIEQGVCE